MIARIQKSMKEKDQGFTLIELLVVMIIIGILAAIAIPVFLSQRKKAQDTAAVADVSTVGKEVATYYVDAGTPLAGATNFVAGGRYVVIPGTDAGKVSTGITSAILSYPAGGDASVPLASRNWCVTVAYTGGTKAAVVYSAASGLDSTAAAACPALVP